MTTDGIIPGFKGIMDLDIRNIEPIHIKQAIDQHHNDIKIYAAEQSKLKPEYRYENTIERIQKTRDYESAVLEKQNREKEDFIAIKDKRRIQSHYNKSTNDKQI